MLFQFQLIKLERYAAAMEFHNDRQMFCYFLFLTTPVRFDRAECGAAFDSLLLPLDARAAVTRVIIGRSVFESVYDILHVMCMCK
jgi:hypothetical protein